MTKQLVSIKVGILTEMERPVEEAHIAHEAIARRLEVYPHLVRQAMEALLAAGAVEARGRGVHRSYRLAAGVDGAPGPWHLSGAQRKAIGLEEHTDIRLGRRVNPNDPAILEKLARCAEQNVDLPTRRRGARLVPPATRTVVSHTGSSAMHALEG